ncbi:MULTISPECIES: hypothetical protein [unclassified Massilia]|nr:MULTISPECIES: hypothetical protein [unclassified Massilia]
MLAVVGFGLCGIVIADANRETRTAILVVVGAVLVFLLFTLGSVV